MIRASHQVKDIGANSRALLPGWRGSYLRERMKEVLVSNKITNVSRKERTPIDQIKQTATYLEYFYNAVLRKKCKDISLGIAFDVLLDYETLGIAPVINKLLVDIEKLVIAPKFSSEPFDPKAIDKIPLPPEAKPLDMSAEQIVQLCFLSLH